MTHTVTHTGKRADGNNGTNRLRPHPFWTKKRRKALYSKGWKALRWLVRMRSPVQIWSAAPEQHLKSSDFGCFLLISAIFGTDAVLRIFADHIKYHRQKRSSRHGIGNSAFLLCVIHAGAWGCCLWAAISAFIWTISSASFCSHSFSLWA